MRLPFSSRAPDGTAIVTNLVSDSFPVIRYALGDQITLRGDERCTCGMQHDMLLEVAGRVGKVIYGTSQQYPSLTLHYVFKNLAMSKGVVLNYQGYQKKKGQLDIRIEGSVDDTAHLLILEECRRYFGTDLQVTIMSNSTLREPGRKVRDFVSELST